MSITTNLEITHVEENQDQKEVTMNTALDKLDGAFAGQAIVDLDGQSGDVTLNEETALQNLVFKFSGALSASVNLIVPDNNKPYWIWHNATGFDVTVKTSGGTGITISPTETQFMYCDGTNVIAISATGGGVGQADEKTVEYLNGLGGTSDLSLANNVLPGTVDVWVDGIKIRRGAGRDFQVTESTPASGNFDQITPEYTDAIPVGAENVEVKYYT